MGGDVPVTVTIEGGVITEVVVGDNSETQGIGSKAIEQLPAEIVAANGIEGVDGISGASVTSKAIFTAVEEALALAASGEAAAPAEPSEATSSDAAEPQRRDESSSAEPEAAAGAYIDGTYEGTGKGMGGNVPVTVTIEGGVITAVEVGDNSETRASGARHRAASGRHRRGQRHRGRRRRLRRQRDFQGDLHRGRGGAEPGGVTCTRSTRREMRPQQKRPGPSWSSHHEGPAFYWPSRHHTRQTRASGPRLNATVSGATYFRARKVASDGQTFRL